MIRPRAPRLAGPTAALLLGAALLTGCSDDDPDLTGATGSPRSDAGTATASPSPSGEPAGPSPSPTASRTARTVPDEADPADVPPFPADTADDTAEPTGGPLTVVAVRAARHDGYDRVVLELDGDQPGEPGWIVRYTDDPRQDGSGNVVEVAGEATLEVIVTGVGYPFDTGVEEADADLTPTDTALVREVDLQATFEGQFQAFVGLDARAPFRVFRLADPARVVLDVQHR